MSGGSLVEIADRVFVHRQPVLDVNATVVVGGSAVLVIDTLSTTGQADDLARAIRAVTPLPWHLVNTHHHFDHCFGNAALAGDPPGEIYAHETVAALLRDRPDAVRRAAHAEMAGAHPRLAAELLGTPIVAPNRPVHREHTVDLGGRHAVLRHPGRGHTAGDLVVHVPDADVLVAGDLVEQGSPPAFEDAFPMQWPNALAELSRLTTARTVVVPGHGSVVDPEFVRQQHAALVELEWLIRDGFADGSPVERVAARAPYGHRVAAIAVRRGYAELSGG